MSKIVVVADSHFSEHSRFDECIRMHAEIASYVERERPVALLHAGDVFESKSTPTERQAVADWLRRVAEVCPVVIARGNHDALGDLPLFTRLRTRHPIVVEESVGVHLVGGVAVAVMAWPRKAELLARLGNVPQEASGQVAAEALRNVLRGLGDQLQAHDGPRVLLSHAMVGGSVTSTGQPLTGCDFELCLADIAFARSDMVAVGHIHKHQCWEHDGLPIVYPGSPRRTAFGELEEKGFVVVDLVPGLPASWKFVELPATRMVLVEVAWCAEMEGWVGDRIGDVRGAEVRVRYEVKSDFRDHAQVEAKELRDLLLRGGAAVVKLEEIVEATTRARAPEIAAARTLADKLRVLWTARGIELGDREPRVLGRLNELEAA